MRSVTPAERTHRIVEHAKSQGFELCGVAPAEKFPELEHLSEWLARGYAGEMRYLHNPKRQSPELALPGARSVIVCAMNYNTPLPYSVEARAALECGGLTPLCEGGRANSRVNVPSASAQTKGASHGVTKQRQATALQRGWISRYAWGDDYHEVLGARLERLAGWMRGEFAEPHESRWYVDTGPIVERVAAKWAGLGWLGKNTCLINEEIGSWLFLGVVITTLELQPSLVEEKRKEKRETGNGDSALGAAPITSHESQVTNHHSLLTPMPDLCGQCTLCIEACPTGALVAPYVLDARRCISYLTIELRGPIPPEFQEPIGWHIFGCDICQDVCPYNRKAPVTDQPEFLPRALPMERDTGKEKKETGSPESDTLCAPPLERVLACDERDFENVLRNSAIRRTKMAGLRRNAMFVSRSDGRANRRAGYRGEEGR